jgi:hypothetical protein
MEAVMSEVETKRYSGDHDTAIAALQARLSELEAVTLERVEEALTIKAETVGLLALEEINEVFAALRGGAR